MYVLERHISRYEALQPHSQLAGQHRGEKYYLRTALQPLHTADRWASGHDPASCTAQASEEGECTHLEQM